MSNFGVLIDSIYILIIFLNPIHGFFQLFVHNVFLSFIYLFMKRTHIQVFKKRMFLLWCFICSDIHKTKYIQINTKIWTVVYLKNYVKFT